MRHEPVSAAELLACKDKWSAAKWLLKLSLGLKRFVGAILERSSRLSHFSLRVCKRK